MVPPQCAPLVQQEHSAVREVAAKIVLMDNLPIQRVKYPAISVKAAHILRLLDPNRAPAAQQETTRLWDPHRALPAHQGSTLL